MKIRHRVAAAAVALAALAPAGSADAWGYGLGFGKKTRAVAAAPATVTVTNLRWVPSLFPGLIPDTVKFTARAAFRTRLRVDFVPLAWGSGEDVYVTVPMGTSYQSVMCRRTSRRNYIRVDAGVGDFKAATYGYCFP